MLEIRRFKLDELPDQLSRWEAYVSSRGCVPLSKLPQWLLVLHRAFGHTPFCLEAVEDGNTCGLLPVSFVGSWLFGRFLVSLPYLNYGGVLADNQGVSERLIDSAADMADEFGVDYLELRHEVPIESAKLGSRRSDKVNMRRALPESADELWTELSSKVRNQVRNARKHDLSVQWGTSELLNEFYGVFRHNMRDLGTPVYSKKLFAAILDQFPGRSELCVVRMGSTAIASAVLLKGQGIAEIPSASSLRRHNSTCANMLMYWSLMERSIQHGLRVFDFGRASVDSTTYRFKKQWGGEPSPAGWQYYLRGGTPSTVRADNPRYQKLVRLWQWLPVSVASVIGPPIVRGIP